MGYMQSEGLLYQFYIVNTLFAGSKEVKIRIQSFSRETRMYHIV